MEPAYEKCCNYDEDCLLLPLCPSLDIIRELMEEQPFEDHHGFTVIYRCPNCNTPTVCGGD